MQLDLARQIETIPYIVSFIDFIAEHKYNLLVLYLEGRIRTKSFDLPPKEKSYTPEEMKYIVDYAAKKDIDVMPVVSTLGHAELFLQFPELEDLAELRGDRQGRFGKAKLCFCPSKKETYDFIEAYLHDLSEIFPFELFHAGCDEVWDIGYCDLCRPKSDLPLGQSNIFAQHLIETREILTKLGKRMVIWDDMFDNYPDALHQIPNEIVLCTWQYDNNSHIPKAHFGSMAKSNKFGLYDQLGFDYVFATREYSSRNITSFTNYAIEHKPMGGFITNWENSENFLLGFYPNIAYAGELWYGLSKGHDVSKIDEKCLRDIFGDDGDLIATTSKILSLIPLSKKTQYTQYLYGPLTNREHELSLLLEELKYKLSSCITKITKDKNELVSMILEDMMVRLSESLTILKLRKFIPEYFSKSVLHNRENLKMELIRCIEDIASIVNTRMEQWQRLRPGIDAKRPMSWELLYENLKKLIDDDVEKTDSGFLTVHYFLPDISSAHKVQLELMYEGESEWVEVAQGVFKPFLIAEDAGPYYELSYPIDNSKAIKFCRITANGYGGQGITFIEAKNSTGRYTPESIREVSGQVYNPENILKNDIQWCFLAEQDTNYAVNNPGLALAKQKIVIKMTSTK